LAAASAWRIAKSIITIFFGGFVTSRFAGSFIHLGIGWRLEEATVALMARIN
jgi:hypothetical protein